MTKRERIDKILFENGLAESRSKAQALIMSGVVLVDERRIEKPSELVPLDSIVRIKGDSPESKYVSRGGLKLEKALDFFHIRPNGYICLDIGSSTGGFTDCLLQHGAARVYAFDSGTNQMVWKLRNDPRVVLRENTNARNLTEKDLPEKADLAVVDVSFISVMKILPSIVSGLKDNGKVITLIKPQFEVGKGEVGKGGIVREPEKHRLVVDRINDFSVSIGLKACGVTESPILGAEGNKEFLALYESGI